LGLHLARPPSRPTLLPYTTLFRSRIAQWSRDRGLGVLGTFRAYDGIDHDSPNFLGILGYGASPVAKRVLAEADLHIYLGCVRTRSEEHTSELQSRENLVCRLLLEK